MDTGEQYIKMCEQAEEIQVDWKPTGGDWYVHDYRGTTKTSHEFEKRIWGDSDKTWRYIEILCYRPSEAKDVVVSTDGETSRCIAVADLVREHSIWLPRQDQLQKIYASTLFLPGGEEDRIAKMPQVMAERFSGFCTDEDNLTSMEQLWLAFVMREKFKKIWDGKDWIKEN